MISVNNTLHCIKLWDFKTKEVDKKIEQLNDKFKYQYVHLEIKMPTSLSKKQRHYYQS